MVGTFNIENDSGIVARNQGNNYFEAPPYNIDKRKPTKRTEPEEVEIISKSAKTYVAIALQESHAMIVFDMTTPAEPVFDSITTTGLAAKDDIEMEKSTIGSEGLSIHPTNGIGFIANEREGSVTMISATWAR